VVASVEVEVEPFELKEPSILRREKF
jgi:hypothetical protein